MSSVPQAARTRPAPVAPAAPLPPPPGPQPGVATPTVALFAVTLVVWLGALVGLATGAVPWLVTVPVQAVGTFLMFTVLHESAHAAASRRPAVNETLGRLSLPFVAPYGSFPMFRFLHVEHHRATNEGLATDPDAWTSHGAWWTLPFRWLTIDVWYVQWYLRRAARRPRAEVVETGTASALFLLTCAALVLAGHGGLLVLGFLLPQRLGLALLAWWFDWLPHHGLEVTQREDRYRATRLRVGLEPLLTPLMLYQNYHLVHHLHPSIPFYRYVRPSATPRPTTSSTSRRWPPPPAATSPRTSTRPGAACRPSSRPPGAGPRTPAGTATATRWPSRRWSRRPRTPSR